MFISEGRPTEANVDVEESNPLVEQIVTYLTPRHPRRSYQVEIKVIKSRMKSYSLLIHDIRRFLSKERGESMKTNKPGRKKITKAEFLAVGEACKTMFCLSPG